MILYLEDDSHVWSSRLTNSFDVVWKTDGTTWREKKKWKLLSGAFCHFTLRKKYLQTSSNCTWTQMNSVSNRNAYTNEWRDYLEQSSIEKREQTWWQVRERGAQTSERASNRSIDRWSEKKMNERRKEDRVQTTYRRTENGRNFTIETNNEQLIELRFNQINAEVWIRIRFQVHQIERLRSIIRLTEFDKRSDGSTGWSRCSDLPSVECETSFPCCRDRVMYVTS